MKQLREIGAVVVLASVMFSPVFVAAQSQGPPAARQPDLVGALKAIAGRPRGRNGADRDRETGHLRVVRKQERRS